MPECVCVAEEMAPGCIMGRNQASGGSVMPLAMFYCEILGPDIHVDLRSLNVIETPLTEESHKSHGIFFFLHVSLQILCVYIKQPKRLLSSKYLLTIFFQSGNQVNLLEFAVLLHNTTMEVKVLSVTSGKLRGKSNS